MLQSHESDIPDPFLASASMPISLIPQSDASADEDVKSPTSIENFSKVPGPGSTTTSVHSYSTTGDTRSVINAAVAARKRGNLSHLSESDRRSEFSYKSESISVAVSDQNRSSKFKVVKLGDKTPYVRGRFTCFDFHDLPVKDNGRMENSASQSTPQSSVPSLSELMTAGATLTANLAPGIAMLNGSSSAAVLVDPDITSGIPASLAGDFPVYNLHLSAPVPIGIVQRTGTLVQSPLVGKPSATVSGSRSPIPPTTPLNGSIMSPEPSRSPVPPSPYTISSPGQTVPASPIVSEQSINDALAKKTLDTTFRIGTTASPTPSGATSRKISQVTAPDTSRLMRPLKGETFFAEMIDRVWETSPGKSSDGRGFERIEGKIQQCMSLVTEHVLVAVKADLVALNSQVKTLRERAASLEYENHALRTENILLRNAVNNPVSSSTMNGSENVHSRSRMK